MPTPHLRHTVLDSVLGLLVGGAAAASAAFAGSFKPDDDRRGFGHGPPRAGDAAADVSAAAFAALPVVVLGVALRRTFPRAGYLAVVLAVAGFLWAGGPYGPVLIAPALAVHALATSLPLRQWVPYLAALPPMLSAGFWREPYLGLTDPGLYPAVIFGTAGLMLPGLLALVHRSRRDAERQDREAELRRAAYEERLRIAQEVHDVVGHSLSVIHMQAGVALHVLEKRPDQVGPSLAAIRQISKEALEELRGTLAVFRGEATAEAPTPGTPVPYGVQPGLDRLPALIGALQAAGRTVRVDRDPDGEGELPAAVDHAAYRIVQEALTNVVRHAPANAPITVSVRHSDGLLTLDVVNEGPPIGPAHYREGAGIAGIRERARAVGGTVDVGPRAGGGFRVCAELPVPDRRSAP